MSHAIVRPVLLFVFVVAILTVAGCDRRGERAGLGVAIPAGSEHVKLADIMENPAAYNGRNVVMKGTISGQCPSLCEFLLRDGVHKATIFPQGYKFPKLTVGKPVTVYAQVTSGEEQVVFSALGVRVE
jgi:hypothetical protein